MKITATSIHLLTDAAKNQLFDEIIVGLRQSASNGSLDYILEELIHMLDAADDEDGFGTEGWRHRFGLDD